MIGRRLSVACIIQRSVGVIGWPLFLRRRSAEGLKVLERVFCDYGVEKVQWCGRDGSQTGNQESTGHLEDFFDR